MKPRSPKRRLRLERLEIRALLAGDGSADLAQALKAVDGTASLDAAFNPNSLTTGLLELSGHGTEAVIIDLDKLPAFVTKLQLSHFSSVTVSGTDHVDYLIASDVESLVAPNLSVEWGTHLHNVGAVEMASAGQLMLLTGTRSDLSVRSLDHTTIISDLQLLRISSETGFLNVDSSNPAQTIELKYRPESITVSGIDSAFAIHFVTAGSTGDATVVTGPIDPAHAPAEAGADLNADGSVIVIKNGVDERTRAFIAELREFLKVSSKDTQRLVLEFLNHSAPESTQTALSNAEIRRVIHANLHDLAAAQQGLRVSSGAIDELWGSPAVIAPEKGETKFSDLFTDRPLHLPSSELLTASQPDHAVEIDATWPVAVVPSETAENDHAFVALGMTPIERTEPKIEESIRAFTDYVVERVAAEFSPGHQSLVLLVDPKPTRSGTVNQTSALDLFGSTTRTTLARLQQVMS